MNLQRGDLVLLFQFCELGHKFLLLKYLTSHLFLKIVIFHLDLVEGQIHILFLDKDGLVLALHLLILVFDHLIFFQNFSQFLLISAFFFRLVIDHAPNEPIEIFFLSLDRQHLLIKLLDDRSILLVFTFLLLQLQLQFLVISFLLVLGEGVELGGKVCYLLHECRFLSA